MATLGANNDWVYMTNTQSTVTTPMMLSVTSNFGDLQITVTGASSGGLPLQGGDQYWTLISLDQTSGPFFGLTPDTVTFFILFSPSGLYPGLHDTLDANGNAFAAYPQGLLSGIAGTPLTFVSFAINGVNNLTGFSDVLTVTP